MAAILFTTGSTGAAKGAVYTHGVFDAQVRLIQSQFSISPMKSICPHSRCSRFSTRPWA
jgi:long-subunit acyl-CoA synthetase (AMP-forming)